MGARGPGQPQAQGAQELPLALYVTDCDARQYGNVNGLYVRVRKDRIRALCPGQWAPDHELQTHDYYYMSVKNKRGNHGNPVPHYYITAIAPWNYFEDRSAGFHWLHYATGEWGYGRVMTGEKNYMRRSAVPDHNIKSRTVATVEELLPIPPVFRSSGGSTATASIESISDHSLGRMSLQDLNNLKNDIELYMEGRARCPEVDDFLTQVQAKVGQKFLALMNDSAMMAKLMAMMGGAQGPGKGSGPSGPGFSPKSSL